MKSLIAIILLVNLIRSVKLNTNVYRFEPIQIVEEPAIGTLILDLASKLDIHDLATSEYKFRFYSPHSVTAHYFLIDQLTGHVKTQRSLDREYLCETKACGPCTSVSNCTLPIEIVAQQANSFKHQKFVSFDVVVEDKNEFAPKFPRDSIVLNISENAPVNFTLPIEAAYDRDSKQTRIIYKMLPSQDEYADFDVQELYSRVHLALVNTLTQPSQSQQQLSLTFLKPFDYEQEKEFSFRIIASDSDASGKKSQPVLSGQCVITVRVIDQNDNIPVFDKLEYEYRLDEDKAVSGVKLIRVHATDRDDGLNGLIKYFFVDQMITLNNPSNGILQQQQQQHSIKSIFSLDEQTGWISVSPSWSNLDYEQAAVYRLTVRAQDSGVSNSMPVYTNVIVYLNDVNDNPPQISLTVPSTLDDFSPNQQPLVSVPVNQLEISEFTPVEQFLAQIVISDLDSGANGKLKIEMTQFKKRTNQEKWLQSEDFTLVHLFNNIYSLMSQKQLDREKHDLYSINITVTDHGQPMSLSTTHKLIIKIKDENDNAPFFVELDSNSTRVSAYEFNMFESVDHTKEESWIIIGRVRALDLDTNENALVKYELTGNKSLLSLFRIDPETGLIRAKNYAIDHELTDFYEFKVIASDDLNQSAASVIIHILDLNDNRPVFEHHVYKFKVKESDPPFTRIGNVKAVDTDKHGTNYSLIKYSILEDEVNLFKINELTGDIYLQNEVDFENVTSHELRVVATDGGNLASQACVVQVEIVDVNDNRPFLLTPLDSDLPLVYSVDNLANNQYLFTVNATDLDRSSNLYGRIKYIIEDEIQIDYLKSTSEEVVNLFECDPTSGHVRVKLTDYDHSDIVGLYALVVKMSDNAGLATNAYLFILFNNKTQLNDSSYAQKLTRLRSMIADASLNVNSNEMSETKFRRLVQLLNSPLEMNELQARNTSDQLAKFRYQIMQAFAGRNYKYFLAFLIAVSLMITFIVVSLTISVCYYKKTNKKEEEKDTKKSAASYGVMLTNGSAAASPLSSITSSELIDNSNFLNTSSSTKKVSVHKKGEYDYYYDDEDDEDGFGHLKKMASLKTDSGMSTKSPSQQSSTASLIKINRFKTKNKQKSPAKRKEPAKNEQTAVEHAELLKKQPNYDSNLNTSGEAEERSLILNTNSPTATTSSASSITSNTQQQLLVLATSNSNSMFTASSSVSSTTQRKKMVASSESLASLSSVNNKTNSSAPQDSPRLSTTSQEFQTRLVDVTDCSSGSPNNFRTFKISYSSPSRQQQQQQHQTQNSYRTMPVKVNTNSLEQKQLNLPVNELFKRYELKKQGVNTISSGSMSSSSQASQPRKIVEINIKNTSTNSNKMSPSVLLQQKQLDESISNAQVPDYFFKDEKEYKKLLANQNKLNCKHVIETETNKLDNKLI